jgi:ARC6-like, IMS domain
MSSCIEDQIIHQAIGTEYHLKFCARRTPSVSTTAEGGSKYWWGSRHGAPISPKTAKRTIQLWQVPFHDGMHSSAVLATGVVSVCSKAYARWVVQYAPFATMPSRCAQLQGLDWNGVPAVLCIDTVVNAQDAKAAALGPRHQVNMLAEVLAEPMLSTVQRQADTAAANGWFWTYQLDGVKVRSNLVERSPQGQLPTWHSSFAVFGDAAANSGLMQLPETPSPD